MERLKKRVRIRYLFRKVKAIKAIALFNYLFIKTLSNHYLQMDIREYKIKLVEYVLSPALNIS